MTQFYENHLINEVMRDFENPEKALHILNFPTCFNCEECKLIYSCEYFNVMSLLKIIQTKQEEYNLKNENTTILN